MPPTIKLADKTPLAWGSTRNVYWHPGDRDLLIKVIRPDAIEARYGRGRPWYKATRRYRHLISYLREVREHIALMAHGGAYPASLPRIFGFAETDLGFGLVVEAAKDRHGRLASTLPRLIEEGRFDAAVHADLMACLDELLASPVILADLHAFNLVYAWSRERGDHFVLIDGVGCKNLIPLNRLSRLVNRHTKRRRIARLMRAVERLVAKAGTDPAALEVVRS